MTGNSVRKACRFIIYCHGNTVIIFAGTLSLIITVPKVPFGSSIDRFWNSCICLTLSLRRGVVATPPPPSFRTLNRAVFAFFFFCFSANLPTLYPDTHVSMKTIWKIFAVKKVRGWGGVGGGLGQPPCPEREGVAAKIKVPESARADFNFRELPWYLSNTYQM